MKKKNGFISTTIIYSFFLVFILIMIAILMSYANKAFLKDKIADNIDQPGDIKEEDGYFNCNKGVDKLSDCLFLAEAREIEEIEKDIDAAGGLDAFNDSNPSKIRQYLWNERLLPINGKYDGKKIETLTTSLKASKIKTRIKYKNYNNIGNGGTPSGTQSNVAYTKYGYLTAKFGEPAVYEEGMYTTFDDYSDQITGNKLTYYYRGAEDDNYVEYADKLWRIIRINGNGTIRMILNEPINSSNPILFNSDTTALGGLGNQSGNNTRYGMGYMAVDTHLWFTDASYYDLIYKNNNSSDVKELIGKWYDNNINYTNGEFLDTDTIFCGDKDIMNSNAEAVFFDSGAEGDGIGAWLKKVNTNFNGKRIGMYYFGAMARLANLNADPTFICPASGSAANNDCHKNLNLSAYSASGKRKYDVASTYSDSFNCTCSINKLSYPICDGNEIATRNDEFTGNGALNKPIATISADEVMLAGGALGQDNKNYYLYNSSISKHTWTMTPGFLDQSNFISKYVEDGVFAGDYTKKIFFFGDVTKENAEGAYYFAIGKNGELMLVNSYAKNSSNVDKLAGLVRPVINLKSDILYCDGDGTVSNPYKIGKGSC